MRTGIIGVLFVVMCLGVRAMADNEVLITKGPYLQWVMPDSITVMWQTSVETSSRVTYYETQYIEGAGQKSQRVLTRTEKSVDNAKPVSIHSVTLNGLKPETEYKYRVSSSDSDGNVVESELVSFKTAVEKGKNTPFSFAVTAESLSFFKATENVFNKIWDYRPEFMLFVGDAVNNGLVDDHWQKMFFEPGKKLFATVPFYIGIGNHDHGHASNWDDGGHRLDEPRAQGTKPEDFKKRSWYYDYFAYPEPKNYYAFHYGNAHFIALDSHTLLYPEAYFDASAREEQLKFLTEQLENSTALWKIVFFHHPLYSSSYYIVKELRDMVVPLFEKHGVDLVFNAHACVYDRSYPIRENALDVDSGVTYITTGIANYPWLLPKREWYTAQAVEKTPHFIQVSIADRLLELRAIDQHGRHFDSFTKRK